MHLRIKRMNVNLKYILKEKDYFYEYFMLVGNEVSAWKLNIQNHLVFPFAKGNLIKYT